MNIEQTSLHSRCIYQASQNLGIFGEFLDEAGRLLKIVIRGKEYLFYNTVTPFNTSTLNFLFKDKAYTYIIFGKEITTPYTKAYFDPFEENRREINTHSSYQEVASAIEQDFEFPVVMKPNRGMQGRDVYKCDSSVELLDAVKIIFDHDRKHSAGTLVVQDYIDIKKELRAVWFKGEVVLLYEKKTNGSKDKNMSPLHNDGAQAIQVTDQEEIKKFEDFLGASSYMQDQVEFTGADIAVDTNGNLHMLELNSYLGFNYFVRDNGEEPLVEMWEKIFKKLLGEEK